MTQLKVYLFGSPYLERQGERVELSLRKALALLIYLLVTGKKVSRDELATMFWPESDASTARANLRRALYIINKNVLDDFFPPGMETVCVNPQVAAWTDVETFQMVLRDTLMLDPTTVDQNDARINELEYAVSLYKDDFLTGFTLPDSPRFDEWQFFESEKLQSLMIQTIQWLIQVNRTQMNLQSAIDLARRWLALDQMHEPAHRTLMELYADSGQNAAAIRQYKECKRILDEELGVPPDAETVSLYQKIRFGKEITPGKSKRLTPETHYVASNDVHIAYVELGDGPIDILWVTGYITHMEHIWELPQLFDFMENLASFSRVILFDRRGVGLSDRVGYAPTLEDTLDDIQTVMHATGAKHPVLLGYLEGGPTSILFSATYPESVSGLILYSTRAKWTRSEDYPWTITREQYDRWLQYSTENWGEPLNLDAYAPSHEHDPIVQDWWAKLIRLASSPGAIKKVLEVMREIDVREILTSVRVPTLILQRRDDRAIRVGAARHLAGQIPGAKYVELNGADHWFFFGDSQAILDEIENFVADLESPIVPNFMLATILLVEYQYTNKQDVRDIVSVIQQDSTYAFLHQEVTRFRGSEVSCRNGCYMATFDGPTRAIHCIKSIMTTASHWDGILRASIHTGECQFLAGELVGTAVNIVKGLLSCATNYEILVSSTVKDLVVGSNFQFLDRGKQVFEDVTGQWGIYTLIY